MSEHIGGVATLIQQVEDNVIYVHCLAHCTNLCLQSGAKSLLSIHKSLDLVMGLGQLIRFPPKRFSLFKTLQKFTLGAPSLEPLCPTQWTVRVQKPLKQLMSTTHCCKMHSKKYTMAKMIILKAVGNANTMLKFSTYFGLKLSHLIFSVTEQLSINIQAKDTTLQEAVQASQLALEYIQRQRCDIFYEQVLTSSNALTDPPTMPRIRKQPSTFSGPKQYFRWMYFEALDTVGN